MSIFTSLRARIPVQMCAGKLLGAATHPGLTHVLASRNDGYGEQPLERLLAVIEWTERHFGCRTVFVEWNPPAAATLISDILVTRYGHVDCYVVTPELHRQVAGVSQRPFLEYYAKNVGIRRACTEWIMVGNTDVIVAPDMLVHFGRATKDPRNIVRTRRVDICFAGRCPGLLDLLDGRKYLRFRTVGGVTDSAPGDNTIASRALWNRARGYDEKLVDMRVHCDCRGMHQLVAHGGRVVWVGTHFHFDHKESTSHGLNSGHGVPFEAESGVPYANPEDWGLWNARQERIHPRIALLHPV